MDTMKIDATSDLTKADVRQAIRTAHDIKQGLFMRYLNDEMTHYLNNTVKKNLRKITEDDDPGYLSESEHTIAYLPKNQRTKKCDDMIVIQSDFAYTPFKDDVQVAIRTLGYDIDYTHSWVGLSIDRSFNDLKEKMDNAKIIGVVTGSNTKFLDKVIKDYAEKVIILPYVVEFDNFDKVDSTFFDSFGYHNEYLSMSENPVPVHFDERTAPIGDAFEAACMMVEGYESLNDDDFKPYLTLSDVDKPMSDEEYYDLDDETGLPVVPPDDDYYLNKRAKDAYNRVQEKLRYYHKF